MRIGHIKTIEGCGICDTQTNTLVQCVLCEKMVCLLCEDVFQLSEFFPDVCKQCATIPKVVDLRELYRHHHERLKFDHEEELKNLVTNK